MSMNEMKSRIINAFTDHPSQTGESYLAHLWFTVGMSYRLLLCSFAILIHGIFPFLFKVTTSSHMKRINDILAARADKLRGTNN